MENLTTTTAATMSGYPAETLVKFCLLWSVFQRAQPPSACNEVLMMDQDQVEQVLTNKDWLKKLNAHQENAKLRNSYLNQMHHGNSMNAFEFHFQHSSRSMSVIG